MVNLDTRALMSFFERKLSQLREDWRTDLNEGLKPVQADLAKLSDRLDGWEDRVKNLEDRISSLEAAHAVAESERQINIEQHNAVINENAELREELSTIRNNWEEMEQRSRLFNIEIQNIPEAKGENLLTILDSLGKIIQTPIPRESVRAIHRVRHNKASDKPKNIIVHLISRWQRDEIIAAARVRREITTKDLGMAPQQGQKHKTVYINEHLTLNNKILFSHARKFGKENSFKHLWVHNGTILLRKTDASKAMPIRHLSDLDALMA